MPSRRPKQPRHRRYDPLLVLSYVVTYQQQHDRRSPSQRQIQVGLHISAPSVVHNMLHKLQRAGLLRITTYGQGRSADLTLTAAGVGALQRWHAEQGAGNRGEIAGEA